MTTTLQEYTVTGRVVITSTTVVVIQKSHEVLVADVRPGTPEYNDLVERGDFVFAIPDGVYAPDLNDLWDVPFFSSEPSFLKMLEFAEQEQLQERFNRLIGMCRPRMSINAYLARESKSSMFRSLLRDGGVSEDVVFTDEPAHIRRQVEEFITNCLIEDVDIVWDQRRGSFSVECLGVTLGPQR